MKTILYVEKPDEIEMSLKITLTIKEWKELKSQLESAWPASALSRCITDMLIKTNSTFAARTEE